MSMRIESTPAQRAAKYLKRIVALTEAKQDSPGKYHLKAGRRHFLVDSEFVRVISHRSKSRQATRALRHSRWWIAALPFPGLDHQ